MLWAAALVPTLVEAVAFAAWVRWRFVRCSVEGESMLPELRPGDMLIADRGAYRNYRPRAGHVVLVPDPREPARLLVKRIEHLDLHHNAWLLGDNPGASTDSRIFGAVPLETIVARVRWRYWPFSRAGWVD